MKTNGQKGFTLIGLLIVFSIIGVIVLSIIKVFPVYMENFAVSKSMESLENDNRITRMTPNQVEILLLKKLDVNAVTSVTRKEIKIRRSIDELSVKVAYEVRKDYFGNLDIVMTFLDEFKVKI